MAFVDVSSASTGKKNQIVIFKKNSLLWFFLFLSLGFQVTYKDPENDSLMTLLPAFKLSFIGT